MSAAKIRKGDKVVVLSGRDKGKTGEITAAMPKDGKVVVVGGEHRHPSQEGDPGKSAGRARAPRSADACLEGRD